MFTPLKIRAQAEKLVGNIAQLLFGLGTQTASTLYSLHPDGQLELYQSDIPSGDTLWKHWYLRGTTTGIGASYEARFTYVSGDSTTNPLVDGTTWWSLSSERTLNKSGGNAGSTTILVEIRRAGQASIIASGNVKLQISIVQ